MSLSGPSKDQSKRPWIAMQIETTSWPIPYWIRNWAHKIVDKWYGVTWDKKKCKFRDIKDESVQA